MPDQTADWRKGAKAEYSAKRRLLHAEEDRLAASVAEAQARIKAIRDELDDLDRGARAFGITLEDQSSPQGWAPFFADPPDKSSKLIKDIVLDLLQDAHPEPLKAKEIKEKLEAKLGRQIHPKTPGMTLFRLSKDRKARRVGRDWFFVPARLFPEEAI